MNFKRAQYVTISVFVLLFVFGAGYLFGAMGFIVNAKNLPRVHISREVPAEKDLDFQLFWRVWDTVKSSYYDKTKINEGNMVYGAIKGMVSSMGDPYTAFLTPNENKVTQEDLKGNFEGVGIQIGYKGTQMAVMAPLPNTPADKAGIQAGDLILGIKDEARNVELATTGLSLPEAVQKIRGPKGSTVTLTLYREGDQEPKDVDLVRENIDVPSVIVDYKGEGQTIAHMRLLKFAGETKEEWTKAVAEVTSNSNVRGVILDLRNNPGGYLQGAIDIASEFVPLGSVVVIEEKGNGQKTEFKSEVAGRMQDMKVVVLVNKGSASASEILAGALRDLKGFKVVGQTTFGKGTVQEPMQLENGSGLHITVGKWLTPKSVWVHEKGLEPDVVIENKTDTTEDEQVDGAVKLLQ